MRLDVSQQRFIENGHLPGDAKVVDYTWRYVNKSGGPDRRFANNAQLPICLYDELLFSSGTGLKELIQVSFVVGWVSIWIEQYKGWCRLLQSNRATPNKLNRNLSNQLLMQ